MDLQKTVQNLAKEAERKHLEDFKNAVVEQQKKILTVAFDKAATYTNLILVVGYVLFFSFWNTVREEVDPKWSGISVLCVGLSLVLFLVWEVGSMIYNHFKLRAIYKTFNLNPKDFKTKIEEMQEKENGSKLAFYSVWSVILVFTIIPGFGGAIIMFWKYAEHLLSSM